MGLILYNYLGLPPGQPVHLQVLMGWAASEMAVRYVASTGRALGEAVESWNQNYNGNNGRPVVSRREELQST